MNVLKDLIGKTIIRATTDCEDAFKDTSLDLLVKLECGDGIYYFYHYQQCCENVGLADVIGGKLSDLRGKVLRAEEKSRSGGEGEGYITLWTFYDIVTSQSGGVITLRFCGTSNGYYSVSVDFAKKEELEDTEII